MAFPPLPRSVYSALGPVAVEVARIEGKDDDLGDCDWKRRCITITPGMPRPAAWAVLFHEMVHLALFDSGVHVGLSKEQEEAVCDAVSLYLAGAVHEGRLKPR